MNSIGLACFPDMWMKCKYILADRSRSVCVFLLAAAIQLKAFLPSVILAFLWVLILPLNAEALNPQYAEVLFGEKTTVLTPQIAGGSVVLTFRDQWSPVLAEKVNVMQPPLLRFPAGTHAMYYDWETGQYGNWPSRNAAREPLKMTIDDYFSAINMINADVSYVVNVYQDTPRKTGKLARHVKSKGYRVRYWELGNEVYAPQYSKRFPDVFEYLRIAREHAKEIRAVFPDAEIGVVAENQLMRFSSWNGALNEQTDFANIILHRYCGPKRDNRERLFRRKGQISIQNAYATMLSHSARDAQRYTKIFPGKKYWISEWGTLFVQMDVQNSLAHAIWMARTFLLFFRTPEITMAAYWNINASPFELVHSTGTGIVHRVPYFIYRMVLDQLRWARYSRQVKVTVDGSTQDELDGQLLLDDRGTRALFIVNGTGRDTALRLPLPKNAKVYMNLVGGDDVGVSNGHSTALSDELKSLSKERVGLQHVEPEGNVVQLPKYAVALISWKEGSVN